MAEICCGATAESEQAPPLPVELNSQASRLRRLDLLPVIRIVADAAVVPPLESRRKRQKLDLPNSPSSSPSDSELGPAKENKKSEKPEGSAANETLIDMSSNSNSVRKGENDVALPEPKFGSTSVCGRRRDMEDAVSIHTSLCVGNCDNLHFFGVFDGHGCSHVATKCRERLHKIVKEEVEASTAVEWKETMEKSFCRMDEEISVWNRNKIDGRDPSKISCKCELKSPQCDAVGSTAVVAVVTPDKIVVSNCGDSRAVLCRNGVAVPLSYDHKADRPDELDRIQQAGGRVFYWDGHRVLGVLAMSRAIGDNYLKPYVIPEPEVTVVNRTEEDECLILASDGLWDVVPNETACGVASMCLREAEGCAHNACSDAALLLTKLALARHSADNVSVVVVDLRRNRRL